MMKNFTKILLGLFTLASSMSANAMEWRVVSSEDFGGNSESDPIIRTSAPHDKDADQEDGFYTPLQFVGLIDPTPGQYMVLKSTGLAETQWGDKLTDCDGGGACWKAFGDHTNPDDENKGYYMIFDASTDPGIVDINSNLMLYKKSLPVSCTGVQFKFTAWMASASDWGGNTVRLSIQDQNGNNLTQPYNDDLSTNSIAPGKWKLMTMEFSVPPTATGNKVYFGIMATTVNTSGFDLALDDITIEVKQPEIKISASEFQYKQPATLTASYDQSEFNSFFPGGSTVKYEWYFKKPGQTDDQYTKVSSGTYTAGSDITHTISAFEKENNNGTYKLIVATEDNLDNNLCSVQKTFVIDENKNKLTVDICQDSTKVVEGKTVKWNQGYSDESLEITVNSIAYTTLEPKYISQCMNTSYPTEGDIEQDPVITKDANGCPITVQKQYLRVKDENVKDDPKHLCDGDSYITNNNVPKTYTYIDEDDERVGHLITFDKDNCRHEQLVFVHPLVELDSTVKVCKGETFNGKTYNEAGVFNGAVYTDKTEWGCKKTITPKINVLEPVEVEIEEIHCPSDNWTYGGITYNYPIQKTIVVPCKGCAANGCDSTTTIKLTVNEGGVTELDTLICREQILFGKTYNEAGNFTHTIYGTTESGCQKDTIWNIEVVQISLQLRMPFNQDQVCEGQPAYPQATLKAYDSRNGKEYMPTHYWEPDVPQNTLTPKVFLKETTTYTIYADLDLPADIDRNAKGCHAKESVTIKVNPMPELIIDSVDTEKRTVEYTVTGGTLPYHLYVADANSKSPTKKDLGLTEENEGLLEKQPFGDHMLQVLDSTGCMAEQLFKIEATQPEPMQFFSPNGDGENDRWKVKNIDVYENSTVRIYDRFGKLILEAPSQEFEEGWDGTYNGKHLPATDYWYEIDIEEIDRQYVGHFTLIH